MKYIATFYSHFGAVRFEKICKKNNITSKLMPVPRTLSSSCGTCVSYECDDYTLGEKIPDEIEQIVEVLEEGYKQCYKVENS